MRVCQIVPGLALGGTETQLLRFMQHDQSDIEHSICNLGYSEYQSDAFSETDATVHTLGISSKRKAPLLIYRLARFLRKHNFDIIHNHQVQAIIYGRIAARLVGEGPVISNHQNVRQSYQRLTTELEKWTRGLDDVTTAVSKGVKQSFADKNPEPTGDWEVVYNSIDIDSFQARLQNRQSAVRDLKEKYGIQSDHFVFLNVGRYVFQKNQALLIEAMGELVEKFTNIRMFIVGWGEKKRELREKVTQMGLSNEVIITGRADPIHEYYLLADAFVLPSHYEGLSVAALEALATELPIIGTNVPGINELVETGRNGYLVSPDSHEQLAEAMGRTITEMEIEEFGSASLQLVQTRFSIASMVDSYHKIYDRVIS